MKKFNLLASSSSIMQSMYIKIILKRFIFYICVCVHVCERSHTCRNIHVDPPWGCKRMTNPLELELKVINKLPDVMGIEPIVPYKNSMYSLWLRIPSSP